MLGKISLYEYYEILDGHDWHYEMSDDGRVYQEGKRSKDRIDSIRKQSPGHEKLCDEFKVWMFRDGAIPVMPEKD